MSRRSFRQSDLTRAIRGVTAAGVEVHRIEIEVGTGNIVISTTGASKAPIAPYDQWKAETGAR